MIDSNAKTLNPQRAPLGYPQTPTLRLGRGLGNEPSFQWYPFMVFLELICFSRRHFGVTRETLVTAVIARQVHFGIIFLEGLKIS